MDCVSHLSFDVRCRILVYLNYKGLRAIQFLNSTWRNTLMEFEPDETGEDADCSFGVFRHKITTILYCDHTNEWNVKCMQKWCDFCFRVERNLLAVFEQQQKATVVPTARLQAELEHRTQSEVNAYKVAGERLTLNHLYALLECRDVGFPPATSLAHCIVLLAHLPHRASDVAHFSDDDTWETYSDYLANQLTHQSTLLKDTDTRSVPDDALRIVQRECDEHSEMWTTPNGVPSGEILGSWVQAALQLAAAWSKNREVLQEMDHMKRSLAALWSRATRFQEMGFALRNAQSGSLSFARKSKPYSNVMSPGKGQQRRTEFANFRRDEEVERKYHQTQSVVPQESEKKTRPWWHALFGWK